MKCENCGENEANVRYTQIINGVKKQMSLCDKCAKELGLDDISFNMPISFSSFLGDMFSLNDNDFIPDLAKHGVLACNKCNMTYDEFLSTGELGCDNCYDIFKLKIDPLLKNIHGANRHIGRIGKIIEEKENSQNKEKIKNDEGRAEKKEKVKEESKIELLQERLKKEIEEERYEDAAKTRDEIKKLSRN